MKNHLQRNKIKPNDNDYDLSFLGLYRGEIVDNDDPEKLFRIKVRIFELYQDLDVKDLPWAWPCFTYGGGGISAYGQSYVPPNGSTIWVAFEHGNVDKPVWLGTFYGKPFGFSEAPIEFKQKSNIVTHNDDEPLINQAPNVDPEYPKNLGIKTQNGIVFELDDTPGKRRIHLYHPSGSHLEFRENGDVAFHIVGDFHIVTDGNKRELVKLSHFRDVLQNQTFTVGQNQTETVTQNRITNILQNDTLTIQGNRVKTVTGLVNNTYQSTLTQTVTGPVANTFQSTYTKNVTGVAIDNYLSTYTMNVTLAMIINALVSYTRNSPLNAINSTGPYTLTASQPGNIEILQTSNPSPNDIRIISSFGNVVVSP